MQNIDIVDAYKCRFVESHYSARWQGIVIDVHKRTHIVDLYLILVLKDRNGNIPRKRIIKQLDEGHTIQIKKFDLSNINVDWFKRLPIFKD